MIRSSIGIVCVLVLLTTCAQSTAAQGHGDFTLNALRSRALQSQICHWIELADQGISDRILSTDAYHDEFRFRAAPVKQPRNWNMPIVHVRPAKDISTEDISTDLQQPLESVKRSSENPEPQLTGATNGDPVLDWVWESPSDLVVRYRDLDDPFGLMPLNFIPRPVPPQVKRPTVKHSKVNRLELKLTKVTPTKKETVEQAQPPNETQPVRRSNGAPVLDWVWESPSDLVVRYRDLDDPFGQVPLNFIPRPLSTQVKRSTVKQSTVNRLELKLTKVTPPRKETVEQALPTKEVSTAMRQSLRSATPKNGTQPTRRSNGDPVLDWVWESPSDLVVRYRDLDDPFGQVALDFIPRPVPAQVKHSNVKRLELKLEKVKTAKAATDETETPEQKRAMTTGQKDYWNYYGDCDRWNVVFAIPSTLSKPNAEDSQQAVDARDKHQRKSEIAIGLQEFAAYVAQRWEKAVSLCKRVSNRFLISDS